MSLLGEHRRHQEHANVSPAEFANIHPNIDEQPRPIPWARLFPHRQTWSFALGKFLTDPIWWVWLVWVPPILNEKFHVSITSIGLPLVIIYLIADFGSIGGGYISSALIKRGWSVNKSRKLAMLLCALGVVPVIYAPITDSLWVAVLLIGLAAASHQGW